MWFVLLIAINVATGQAYVLAKQEVGHKQADCKAVAQEAERRMPKVPGHVVIGVCRAEV